MVDRDNTELWGRKIRSKFDGMPYTDRGGDPGAPKGEKVQKETKKEGAATASGKLSKGVAAAPASTVDDKDDDALALSNWMGEPTMADFKGKKTTFD